MKTLIIAAILLSFCGTTTAKNNAISNQPTEKDSIQMIVYHYVDHMIFTIISIPCEEFYETFSRKMVKDTITDNIEIAFIKSGLDSLNKLDVNWKTINTRAKLYLISAGNTIEYCVDNGFMYFNNTYYRMPDSLYEYFEKYMKYDED